MASDRGWHPHKPPGPTVRGWGSEQHPVRVTLTDATRTRLVALGWTDETRNPLEWAVDELEKARARARFAEQADAVEELSVSVLASRKPRSG